MVKFVVAYGLPDDPNAFDQYYATTHASMARAVPGLSRYEAGKVVGTPDDTAPMFYFIEELAFDSADAIATALTSDPGQAMLADLSNLATGGVAMMNAAVE